MIRPLVNTAKALSALDGQDEIVQGYLDGFGGEPEPGDNRSDGYWHGWRNGRNDRAGKSDPEQLALAHDLRRQPKDGQ